jgi:uncharacterized protein (DUF2267 family)
MQYNDFIGKVQQRCRLGTTNDAVRATRVTLEVLGERLFGNEKGHLASQLPSEIGHYLREVQQSEKFDLDEFYGRVSRREGVGLPEAAHHARSVLSVVREAVSPGQWENVRHLFPEDYARLFEAGSEGEAEPR